MRVAAVYDVHAMPWALEPVLDEVEADVLVFGGDLVGGPCPRETLDLVRPLDAVLVRGNAEDDPQDWDREHLSTAEISWLRSLPLTAEVGRASCRERV